eukprot:scaffold4078_cov68-Phaeocystis_antarctica.AAC.28
MALTKALSHTGRPESRRSIASSSGLAVWPLLTYATGGGAAPPTLSDREPHAHRAEFRFSRPRRRRCRTTIAPRSVLRVQLRVRRGDASQEKRYKEMHHPYACCYSCMFE